MESTKEAYKWTDAKIEENTYLTKDAAEKRFQVISDVEYKLSFALRKGGESFHGH